MLVGSAVRRVAIIGGARIPFARAHGAYSRVGNLQMLTAALQAVVGKYGLDGLRLGEVAAGAVIKHSRDFNLARESVLGTTLDPHTPAFDLQRACGTSLEAAIGIANKIALGQIDSGLAGGVDTVSDPPIVYPRAYQQILMRAFRAKTPGARIAPFFALRPGHFKPVIPDASEPRTGLSMGESCEQMAKRSIRWVARLPAIFLATATPLYLLGFVQPTSELDRVFILWALAFMLHYGYLGAQYTIGQGVVPQRSRASAIAILLFIIALVGNGVGPQIVGVLSDSFMTLGLEQRGLAGVLDVAACNPKVTSALPAAQQAACSAIYAEGLRNSMMVTALLLLVAATCFWMSSRHLDRDMLVR
ncbi:MAG: hypothetical protein EB018_09455 [Gammaproteobacteria bacterium]|nr:hypothetical protein [Gammaproteobacteria bacterium]